MYNYTLKIISISAAETPLKVDQPEWNLNLSCKVLYIPCIIIHVCTVCIKQILVIEFSKQTKKTCSNHRANLKNREKCALKLLFVHLIKYFFQKLVPVSFFKFVQEF